MASIGDAWVDGSWVFESWVDGAWFKAGVSDGVVLSGTVTTADEQHIRTGGRTIILTVTGDTWVSGVAFDNARQAIIDGLTSDSSETLGWNNEVRDEEVVTAVVRTSDTVVTITLSASPSYDITASETITATIPLIALTSAPEDPVVASPTFTIVPFVVTAELGGSILDETCEADLVTGGREITLTLTNDTWVPLAGGFGFNLFRQQIIDGLNSAQSEATGWNAEIRDKEVVEAVVRTSDTVVTITLTASAAYDITATETITATLPAIALSRSSVAVVASPTFEVCTDDEVEPPIPRPPQLGRGGPDPRKRVPGWRPPHDRKGQRKDRGRTLTPFTGRGFFPDEDDEAPAPRDEAPPPSEDSAPIEDNRPGLDEVAVARARRADESLALARSRLEAEREALERREAEERVLAFLLAERAATEARQRAEASIADDEAVMVAYLEVDQVIRAHIVDLVQELVALRRPRLSPAMVSQAGELLDEMMRQTGESE